MADVSRRFVLAVAGAALALAAAGCSGPESQQRQAFIAFLQTRILDKPGLHIPIMTDRTAETFGRYAADYRVLSGFHRRLDSSFSPKLVRMVRMSSIRSLPELLRNRAFLVEMREGVAGLTAALDAAEAEAAAAHAALRQPSDLKRVYDAAYERMVTTPARVLREVVPLATAVLPPVIALAEFAAAHPEAVQVGNGTVTTTDPALQPQLAALLQETRKAAALSQEGKRKLQVLAAGR